MGLDFHALSFLRLAQRMQPLGAVATLGRQTVQLTRPALEEILDVPVGDVPFGSFCEDLLTRHFGATAVHSFDNSDFEAATFVQDFNRPLPEGRGWRGQYDTVIDFGTLEHIFDVPQALRNMSDLCRPGGQILHVLPANNFNGHGFYQFSPELFASLYAEANGYGDTLVMLAKLSDHRHWYLPQFAADGERLEFVSLAREYVMVRTRRREAAVRHAPVQQSDYVVLWDEANSRRGGTAPPVGDYGLARRMATGRRSAARRLAGFGADLVERSRALRRSLRPIKAVLNLKTHGMDSNPGFRKVSIERFIEHAATPGH